MSNKRLIAGLAKKYQDLKPGDIGAGIQMAAYNNHHAAKYLIDQFQNEKHVLDQALCKAAGDPFYPIEIIEYLIEKGANINAKDTNGNSPAHLAVLRDNMKVTEILLEKNAKLSLKNNAEETPLDIAKKSKNKGDNLVELLYNQLITAINVGDLDKVQRAVENGADVNYGQNPRKSTPLHTAIQTDKREITKYLLLKGAYALNQVGKKAMDPAFAIESRYGRPDKVVVGLIRIANLTTAVRASDQRALKELSPNEEEASQLLSLASDNAKISKVLIGYGAEIKATESPSGPHWTHQESAGQTPPSISGWVRPEKVTLDKQTAIVSTLETQLNQIQADIQKIQDQGSGKENKAGQKKPENSVASLLDKQKQIISKLEESKLAISQAMAKLPNKSDCEALIAKVDALMQQVDGTQKFYAIKK